jgi:Zn-dependent metalloprotease
MALALLLVAVGTTTVTATPAAAAPTNSLDPQRDPAVVAADALVASDHLALFRSPHDAFIRTGAHEGTHGLRFVSYDRTHRGLPVIGGDFVVVTDAAGTVLDTAVSQQAVLSVDPTPAVSAAVALTTARSQLAMVQRATPPRLAILAWDTPRLVWEVSLTGIGPDGSLSAPVVYIDARTGAVADRYDRVVNGTGNGFYNGPVFINTSGSGSSFSMLDSTRPGIRCGGQNGATFTGSDDIWGNGTGTSLETACVDVLYAVQRMWDMLDEWLGRDGINGSGDGFAARVGWDVVNASWNGSNTNFGHTQDNQRQATPIDIVAHEYGHAVFQTTPGGSGSGGTGNEKPGLNEATSDIFGAITEEFADNPNDPPDFLVGEEANLTGIGAIRVMYDPSQRGHPNCYSSAIPTTSPVHAAGGPLNHWFYLVSQGSNPAGGPASPICAGGPSSVTGIGILKAAQIYYNALLAKTTSWRYVNVRRASMNAVVNMFGSGSAECVTVKAAWDAVSVPAQSGEPVCGGQPPPPPPPPPGAVFADDFEAANGWTTNGGGGDTATSGQWQRGDPQATSSGGVSLQLGNTTSGVNGLITGPLAGSGAGANDVDNGITTIRSPLITLPSSGSLSLSFSWYLAHLNNSSSADFFRVRIVTGGSSSIIGTASGAATNRAGSWATASLSLNAFAGQTIRVQFEAADLSGASLVEAGVDDVVITSG